MTVVAMLIIVGALIYILFREPVYFTRPFIGDTDALPLIHLPDNAFSFVLRYLLPDALWCVALIVYATSIPYRVLRIVAMMMPIAMEIAQIWPFVPGTFDVLDLCTYIIITLTIISIRKMKKSKITLLVNCLVLASFAAIAMASGSSKNAVDAIDGFSEGWQYGRSLTSDAVDEVGTAEFDSIFSTQKVVASKK